MPPILPNGPKGHGFAQVVGPDSYDPTSGSTRNALRGGNEHSGREEALGSSAMHRQRVYGLGSRSFGAAVNTFE